MQVGESTLKTLVEGQKQFQIPLYQRQYSWDTAQLSQLWEDVVEQYDLLTPDENGRSPEAAPSHFLGSMVLAPSPLMQAHGVTPFLVIDGQQRLTTLFLAICAFAICALRDRQDRGHYEHRTSNTPSRPMSQAKAAENAHMEHETRTSGGLVALLPWSSAAKAVPPAGLGQEQGPKGSLTILWRPVRLTPDGARAWNTGNTNWCV